MKKKIILIILLLAAAAFFGFILIKSENGEQNLVCFANDCFRVELAQTPEERAQGLMFREDLRKDEGMLFIFQTEEEHSFWMKNTLIPLDIIWIDQNNDVVFISKNTQPCSEDNCPSINPNKMARYVLELKGGTSEEIKLNIGDKAEIRISE